MIVAAQLQAADEPPLVGQPDHFSGAVGSFKIVADASPTEVAVEEPLMCIVRITATGPIGAPPSRPNLRQVAKFAHQFQIQDLPDRDQHNASSNEQSWEFYYQLRPRNENVREIPALRFVYFKPGSVPVEKGYRTTYTRAIPLKVWPKTAISTGTEAAPEWIYRIAEGPDLLKREPLATAPRPELLGSFVVVPPLACLAWYVVWRNRHPAAAVRRRSLPARQALAALQRDTAASPDESVLRSTGILQNYLIQKLDAPLAEFTAANVVQVMTRAGYSSDICGDVESFFLNCDAVRFSGEHLPQHEPIRQAAQKIIQSVEAVSCSP